MSTNYIVSSPVLCTSPKINPNIDNKPEKIESRENSLKTGKNRPKKGSIKSLAVLPIFDRFR